MVEPGEVYLDEGVQWNAIGYYLCFVKKFQWTVFVNTILMTVEYVEDDNQCSKWFWEISNEQNEKDLVGLSRNSAT